MRKPFFRKGEVLCQGEQGIFKVFRTMGETAYLSRMLSRISMTQKSDSLPKELGDSLREKERATATAENMKLEMSDPVCSCCCCPFTPAPTGRNAAALIDRYVMPKKGEVDIYE